MAGYLLLRDNKESGPYSLDDLAGMGLKAYDLVWVQGKSAAWRYPSEIEELRPIAPAVEEQPFDRFYKKTPQTIPTDPQTATEPDHEDTGFEKAAKDIGEHSRYAPAPSPESHHEQSQPKRSVFVTMPGQRQFSNAKHPAKPPMPAPLPQPAVAPAPLDDLMEVKYSQPLDEIKERYVRTLLDRKDKKSRNARVIEFSKKAAVIVLLIGTGLAAGFYFKSTNNPQQAIAGNTLRQGALINPAAAVVIPSTEKETTPPGVINEAPVEKVQRDEEPITTTRKIKEAVKINEEQEPTTVRIRKETMLVVPKEKNDDFPSRSPQFSREPAESDPITGERNARMRKASDLGFEDKTLIKSLKKSLHDQVSVSSNDYKRVAFGGIRNLYLTVTNNSRYELDNVIVEVQYLKPSEELLMTEKIRFRSVVPNGTATMRVPDTNRGIKINYRIITIEPKDAEGVALKF